MSNDPKHPPTPKDDPERETRPKEKEKKAPDEPEHTKELGRDENDERGPTVRRPPADS